MARAVPHSQPPLPRWEMLSTQLPLHRSSAPSCCVWPGTNLACPAGQETVGQQGWLWEQESGVRWGRQKGDRGGVLRDWLKEKALRKQDYEQKNNTEKKGRSCWSHDGCLHCRCTLQGDTTRSPVWAAVPAAGGNIREKKESTGCSQRCVQKGLRAPLGRAERSLAVISSIFKGLKAKKVQRGLAPKFAEITHQMPYNL